MLDLNGLLAEGMAWVNDIIGQVQATSVVVVGVVLVGGVLIGWILGQLLSGGLGEVERRAVARSYTSGYRSGYLEGRRDGRQVGERPERQRRIDQEREVDRGELLDGVPPVREHKGWRRWAG